MSDLIKKLREHLALPDMEPGDDDDYMNMLICKGEEQEHARTRAAVEILLELAEHAAMLDIGRIHSVRSYDVDGDATCYPHCSACKIRAALKRLEEVVR